MKTEEKVQVAGLLAVVGFIFFWYVILPLSLISFGVWVVYSLLHHFGVV